MLTALSRRSAVNTGITKVNLNLRSAPSAQGTILQTLPKGTTITILDLTADWLHVTAPDSTNGYVSAQYVDVQPLTPAAPPTSPVVTVPPAPPVVTTPPSPPVVTTPPITPTPPVPPATPIDTTPIAPPTAPAPPTGVGITKLLVPSGASLNVRSSPAIVASPDNKIETVQAAQVLIPLESDASVASKIGTTQDQGFWIHVRTPDGKEGYVAAWLSAYQGSAPVHTADPSDLDSYIAALSSTEFAPPQGYKDFWAQQQKLGLPNPFNVSPTQLGYPALSRMPVNGFGPNTFSLSNWRAYYSHVDGMHNGLDHIVPLGTPLLAVSDGVIVGTQQDWQFLGNANDKSIILWCYLPESIKDAQGRRMLSNVLVAYGHLSDNTVVKRHDVVKAGQQIGVSGRPFGETANDHLHMEVHLLSGDPKLPHPSGRRLLPDFKRAQPFANSNPFNPLLFFSERLVRYHLAQGKKMGFGSSPTYPNAQMLAAAGLQAWPPLDFFSIASFQYGAPPVWTVTALPWPNGIYDLPTEVQRVANFTQFDSYAADFL